MNYQETLHWMYQQLPMYQRQGKTAFKKNLDNIIALCSELGQPQLQFPAIHIAGTNGKGSTAHLIAAALQAQGLKTGLYTSPHYRDFRERIKINGSFITKKQVVHFIEQHQTLLTVIRPSFFEITVAMAFQHFASQKVDIAIIETGLGGRLDSTNIITPLLSVITNISFDHQAMLGDTLPLIAAEKAGIIKEKVPVVIGETQAATKGVFIEKANATQSEITFADQHWKVRFLQFSNGISTYDITRNGKCWSSQMVIQLAGSYQQKNIQTALAALEKLSITFPKFSFLENDIRNAWANLKERTNFIGRWELIGEEPTIIADSAHNEAGLREAMQHLSVIPKTNLHIVMGMVNDKDRDKVLSLFPKTARYYFAKPAIPRGLSAETLQQDAHKQGLGGRTYVSVKNALAAAKRAAAKTDVIYVGGSTFVVAEVI